MCCFFGKGLELNSSMQNILELEQRLRNNEELHPNQYMKILSFRKNSLIDNLSEINASFDYILKDRADTMAFVFTRRMDFRFFLWAYGYLVCTIKDLTISYADMIQINEEIHKNISRYNTLNFLRHCDEIQNYETLISKFDDKILSVFVGNADVSPYEVVKEEATSLDKTRNKIRMLSRNYIK